MKGLEYAVELASLFHAELSLVYVLPVLPPRPTAPSTPFEIPEYEAILHKEAEQQLKVIISQRLPKNLKVRSLIGHGHPAQEIVRLAGEEKMDLIVIATHGHTGWQHLMVGSVAEKVIRTAPCPVFAVREPRK